MAREVRGRCVQSRPAEAGPLATLGTDAPGPAGRLPDCPGAGHAHPSVARENDEVGERTSRRRRPGARATRPVLQRHEAPSRDQRGIGEWAHLAHPRHPGDHQLEDKLVLHRHLGEKEVHPVVPTVRAVRALSDHVRKDEVWLCGQETPGYPPAAARGPGTSRPRRKLVPAPRPRQTPGPGAGTVPIRPPRHKEVPEIAVVTHTVWAGPENPGCASRWRAAWGPWGPWGPRSQRPARTHASAGANSTCLKRTTPDQQTRPAVRGSQGSFLAQTTRLQEVTARRPAPTRAPCEQLRESTTHTLSEGERAGQPGCRDHQALVSQRTTTSVSGERKAPVWSPGSSRSTPHGAVPARRCLRPLAGTQSHRQTDRPRGTCLLPLSHGIAYSVLRGLWDEFREMMGSLPRKL